jgi:cytochrome b involved in lipid metabolism
MKTYRIQARALGKYLVDIIKANSSDEALDNFSKKVKEGSIEISDEGFYVNHRTFITYEEINESSETGFVKKTSALGT